MYLEHANVTVSSIDQSMAFLQIAFPEFRNRGGGAMFGDESLGRWVHFGDDETYIALQQVNRVSGAEQSYQTIGVNHLGFVVDDIYAIVARYRGQGYEPTDASALGAHPSRERVYFIDDSGLEWEFVQYLSEETSERNDYST